MCQRFDQIDASKYITVRWEKNITLLTFLKHVTTSVPAFQIPVKYIIMALLKMGIFLKASWEVFTGNTGRTPCKNSFHFLSCYEVFFPKEQ